MPRESDEAPLPPSPHKPAQTDHDDFVMNLIASQNRLYAYVLSLLFDRDRSRDVLQQTNLVLLEKETEFERGSNFFAWAARVAHYEVLADRRRRVRDRHLFSDELLALIAAQSTAATADLDQRAAALGECLKRLSPEHRDLLAQRYRPGGGVAALAQSLGKTPNAVSATLHRVRSALIDCVSRKLKIELPT